MTEQTRMTMLCSGDQANVTHSARSGSLVLWIEMFKPTHSVDFTVKSALRERTYYRCQKLKLAAACKRISYLVRWTVKVLRIDREHWPRNAIRSMQIH